MATRQKTSDKTASASAKDTGTAPLKADPQTAEQAAPKASPAQSAAETLASPSEAGSAKPSLSIVTDIKPSSAGEEIKKKDLIDLVVERSGLKKKDAKPAVEAVIDILGELMAEGRDLNLPPLGKVKHQRTRDTANARIIMLKVRQGKSVSSAHDKAKESVADDDE